MAKKLTSVFTDDMDNCYWTGSPQAERHHIFGGSSRGASERYGFVLPVHYLIHKDQPYSIHTRADFSLALRQMAQRYYEEHCGTREDFMRIFGQNYILNEATDGYSLNVQDYGVPYYDEAC